MNTGKIDNQLNLALDVGNTIREQTIDLDTGFNKDFQTWELIVRYVGDLDSLAQKYDFSYVALINQYAVITIREDQIRDLARETQILFIEKPKRLHYEVSNGIAVSCINRVQTTQLNLTGKGVIVAIIDSGIDYLHPDFRNADGTTRIIELWDQTINGDPPEGYNIGTVYTREQINAAIATGNRLQVLESIPSTDVSGHGTHVAGIACGNGRASEGRYRGVAYESDILVVKLGTSVNASYPNTAQLMEALNYCILKAQERNQPIAINLSFGNNYGSHTGNSILENFINEIALVWKTCICIGTGNEGASRTHTSGTLTEGQNVTIELPVATAQYTFNIQLWKDYEDDFLLRMIEPSGRVTVIESNLSTTQRYRLGSTELYVYYASPLPSNPLQEIYMELIPGNDFVTSGVWQIELVPRSIKNGRFDLWLPSGGVLNSETGFLRPTEDTTLTIPSTATKAITVGAYDGLSDSYAYFSGRGYTRNNQIKPDIVAPGVNIVSAAPNGGYVQRSGTSMATPFVTGSTALLMQWGIIEENDPYLYGEKMKAYLIAGARRLPIESEYPNPTLGWGTLCVRNSIPQ